MLSGLEQRVGQFQLMRSSMNTLDKHLKLTGLLLNVSVETQRDLNSAGGKQVTGNCAGICIVGKIGLLNTSDLDL